VRVSHIAAILQLAVRAKLRFYEPFAIPYFEGYEESHDTKSRADIPLVQLLHFSITRGCRQF
jgi:hypothetical protein